MIRITAHEFWRRYKDELCRIGTRESLKTSGSWTPIAIGAAKTVCQHYGLRIGNELYLDVMAYEQREARVDFNWDLRVAFEHENMPGAWHDELCKLCHIAADLRVLVGYFGLREPIRERLQQRIDLMGDRLTRVQNSQWLFIFGAADSKRNKTPWVAFRLDAGHRLEELADERPLIPYDDFRQ